MIKEKAIRCYSYSIKLCLFIKRNISNKYIRSIVFMIVSPYILLRWILCSIYENSIGKFVISCYIRKDNKIKYSNELSVVAIAKNEGEYIMEWVRYHLVAGIEKIYLYDNESNDGLKDILSKFIEDGTVVYNYFPGKNKQLEAYNHAINKYKNSSRYMAFIDVDEFIVPTKNEKLIETVNRIMKLQPNAGGIGVNWALYGSSGYEKKQEKPLTQTFLKRADDFAWPNFHVKTICNPRLVRDYVSPHFPIYRLGAWSIDSKGKRQYVWYNHDVDFSQIRCNHYFCKSREEFMVKQARGMADRNQKYDFSKFDEYDLNDIDDRVMLRYKEYLNS